MARLLEDFIAHVHQDNLTVCFAQVRQGGEVVDHWGRFSPPANGSLNSFTGVIRMESFSITKSFVSIGAGIALDKGIITLDEKICDSFPEYTYNITDPHILDMTVRDLLTMTMGIEKAVLFRESEERAAQRDWLHYIFQQCAYPYPPGERFLYCNANTYLVGCLIEKKTGRNMLEFLRYRVFEPLGIRNPDMLPCPMGHTVAGNGLIINVDELGRFGEMLLRGGEYGGKRIVSREYVEQALAPQVKTKNPLHDGPEGKCFDYGFQFWYDSVYKVSTMLGAFGQYCVIDKAHDAVVTVLSLDDRADAIGRHVWKDILKKL